MLDLELGLLWGDLIAGTNERAEGVVLVFLGYSPAVHAAEEVNELDQLLRVVSRAKPTESSAQSSRDALFRPAIISNECCVSNTIVSRVVQTQLGTHIHPRVFHPSHLGFVSLSQTAQNGGQSGDDVRVLLVYRESVIKAQTKAYARELNR